MFKKILIFSFILMVAFSQSIISIETGLLGSYNLLSQKQLNDLLQTDDFKNVLTTVQNYWQQTYNEGLGKIIDVQQQLVAGLNYKITFKAEPNKPYTKAIVTVFFQPWTNTIEITEAITQPIVKKNLNRN